MSYSSDNFTHADMGIDEFLYPYVYTGNQTSKISLDMYLYKFVLFGEYVPHAIPSSNNSNWIWGVFLIFCRPEYRVG